MASANFIAVDFIVSPLSGKTGLVAWLGKTVAIRSDVRTAFDVMECGVAAPALPPHSMTRLDSPYLFSLGTILYAMVNHKNLRACQRGVKATNFCMPADKIPWPHAPDHRLSLRGTYFVTASTYLKTHHFKSKARLAVLHRGLLKVAANFGWQLEAWAVFSNHYHFIGHSPADLDSAENLSPMLASLHEKTAKWVNKLDGTPARKVWYNFRDTRLTYEKSYLARLNYVHQNPVKHGLVAVANQYPWCSARWFERTAAPAQIKTIYRFKTGQLNVPDDFEVSPDW